MTSIIESLEARQLWSATATSEVFESPTAVSALTATRVATKNFTIQVAGIKVISGAPTITVKIWVDGKPLGAPRKVNPNLQKRYVLNVQIPKNTVKVLVVVQAPGYAQNEKYGGQPGKLGSGQRSRIDIGMHRL